jgi:hypothetical protein
MAQSCLRCQPGLTVLRLLHRPPRRPLSGRAADDGVRDTPPERSSRACRGQSTRRAARPIPVRHARDDKAETGPHVEPRMDKIQLACTVADQHGCEWRRGGGRQRWPSVVGPFTGSQLYRVYRDVLGVNRVHLTTLVASATTESGMFTPIARAVWRFTASSDLVARPIGRSPGRDPFNIFST